MLYFSELDRKKVVTNDGIFIGYLDDIIFLLDSKPRITKIVVDLKGVKTIINADAVHKFNTVVRIAKYYTQSELEENELYIKRNLLDKQVIDISGNKIVRANDVIIHEQINLSSHNYECYISGVDNGIIGVLRRLQIENIMTRVIHFFGLNLVSKFLSWADIQPLDLVRGSIRVKKEETKLQNMRPEDLADHLEQTNELNIKKFLRLLDKDFATEVISNLNINYQRDLFRTWNPEKAAGIISKMETDIAVDILLSLSKKKRDEILKLVEESKNTAIQKLLALTRTPISKRLSSEYFVVQPTETPRDIIQKIRKASMDYESLDYIYVVNQKKQLIGACNIHELIIQKDDTPIYKFMSQNLIEVHLKTPLEMVVYKIIKYRLHALPVVDSNKELIGIIPFDNISDIIETRFNS
ncbi:MAG: CBS domain-containing protein [Candidatus Taylorbacteria bacterium]|nr:CBS domain-containing protein [Candidatus Taylorbacteria bacterium]